MAVATSRSINNSLDVGRKIPISSLSDRVLTELEGVTLEIIPGTAAGTAAPVSREISEVIAVVAVVTSNGRFVTAARSLLTVTTDYTVTKKNAAGVGAIVPVTTSQALNTLMVYYRAATADATGSSSSVA